MTDHPTITPPPELVQKWFDQSELATNRIHCIAIRAAQWGYDQRGEVNEAELQQARDEELEACIELIKDHGWFANPEHRVNEVRAARRPKPQTLSSIALQMLDTIERDAHYLPEIPDTIRRALEALSND